MTSASRPRLDKRRRTYVRLVGDIHHALNEALNEEKAKRGLNKTEIGKILGLGRSAISKKFDGRHNMTLETLADLAYALDRPVKVMLPERSKLLGSNHPPQPPAGAGTTALGSISAAFAAERSAATANNSPLPGGSSDAHTFDTATSRASIASLQQGLKEIPQ